MPRPTPKTPRAQTRIGKRVVTIYLPEESWRELRQLSLDTGTSAQDLGIEALNLLFQHHQREPIAS
jgi:hypothetical protein